MNITIEPLDVRLSVCKVEDYSQTDISRPFCFTGCTDEEFSLACPTELVPGNTAERDDGWRAFRIAGALDFSLIGILARISDILAQNGIGLFAVTTLFSLVTLPVEINASQRAVRWLAATGFVDVTTQPMASDALKWAAYTYVIAAIGSLATLFYYISLASNRRS